MTHWEQVRVRVFGADAPVIAAPGERDQDGSIARMFAWLELVSILLVFAWLALPGSTRANQLWFWALGVVAVLQALALMARGVPRSMGTIAVHTAIAVGLLGSGVYFSGGAASPLALFYLWIAIFCAWYLPERMLWRVAAWLVASSGVVVVVHTDPGDAHQWSVGWGQASRFLLLAGAAVAAMVLARSFRNRLLDTERLFTAGFEQSTSAMALIDLEGRITRANPAFGRLVGRAAPDLTGRTIVELTHPDDRQLTANFYLETMAQAHGSASYQKRLLAADGSSVWLLVAASLIVDRHGRPYKYFAQAIDITGRVAAEANAKREQARQAALADLGRIALAENEAASLTDQVLKVASAHLGADDVTILQRDKATGKLRKLRHGDVTSEPEPCLRQVAERALAAGEPVMIANTRCPLVGDPSTSSIRHTVGSLLCVPIHGPQGAQELLVAQALRRSAFQDADIAFLQALSNLLAETNATRSAHQQLAHRELHDPLTGLPNLRLLRELVRDCVARPRPPGTLVAVAVFDLDGFSVVNDAVGRDSGDELLRAAADRIGAAVRAHDTVARLDGDEFAVLLPEADGQAGAIRVINRVLASLHAPFSVCDQQINLSATAGIAIVADHITHATAIPSAKAALAHAKQRARGTYMMFDPAMHEHNVGRIRTENALRTAIDTGALTLAYQPLIDLHTGRTLAAEALARIDHPQIGPLPPAEFIPIAEQTGLIIELGHHVLTQACQQLASWQTAGQPLGVSVNISARQLYDDHLPGFLQTLLSQTSANPDMLTLELTETMVVADPEIAQQLLLELKALGIRLALDDYGTGYASLGYLSRFPFDTIKLDRLLVCNLPNSDKDQIIASSTIEMSHALGLTVVAEGIETPEQHQLLKTLGCDIGQGYHYAKPGPAQALTTHQPAAHATPQAA